MKAVISQVQDLMYKCKEYTNSMATKHADQDPRARCFRMICNEATVTSETLSAYVRLFQEQWGLLLVSDGLTHSEYEEQLGYKANLALKSLFVQTVSKIEYNIRETIRLYPGHRLEEYIDRKEKLLDHFDQVYDELDQAVKGKLSKFRQELRDVPPYDSFQRIIQASRKMGIIDKDVERIWDCIIRIRNYTVHNNSISDRDDQIKIDERYFQFRKNQMIEGKVDFYLFFSRKATELFFVWGEQIN